MSRRPSPARGFPRSEAQYRNVVDPAEAGFTLIETLVAFVILTLSLTTAFGVLAQVLRGGYAAEMKREALRLAQGRLDELGISEPIPTPDARGRTPEGFAWIVHSRRLSVGSRAAPDAAWIDVSVWVPGSSRDAPDVSLATLRLLRPTP